MFSLHETTQKRVCRVAFLVCCVVPTLWTVGWIAYFHRPWHLDDWQRTLTQRLHVRAEIGDFSYPRPGVTELVGLELTDLRSNQSLGSIDKLRIQRRGTKLELIADHVKIEARQFHALAAAVKTWFTTPEMSRVELHADKLTILGRLDEPADRSATRGRFEMTHLSVHGEPLDGALQRLWIQANPEREEQGTSTSTATVRLVIEPGEDRQSPHIHATLDTQQSQLPAWLLEEVVPGMGRCLGARFAGSLQIESSASHLGGSLAGRFAGVDIRQWIDPTSPHRLQGTADVRFEHLVWQDGRVVVAEGQLLGGAGVVSRSLLDAAGKRLFCELGPQLKRAEKASIHELQPFDELACRFRMTSAGITLSGMCSVDAGNSRGCLLAVDRQPVLMEPGYVDLPVAQLVQMLAQPATSWLPATREAHEMAGALPLPGAAPVDAHEVASRSDDEGAGSLPR